MNAMLAKEDFQNVINPMYTTHTKEDCRKVLHVFTSLGCPLTLKLCKQLYKGVNDCSYHDPLEKPLSDSTRRRVLDNDAKGTVDETIAEYGLYDLDWANDETTAQEVEEWFDSNYGSHNYSQYDCSGKLCTTDVHAHKNPNGLWTIIEYSNFDM